jgi:hypothetical protein
MGKAATTQIRWWGWFFPHNIIQDSVALLQQCHAHTQVYVQRAGNPNSPSRFERTAAGFQPRAIEFMVKLNASASVPLTFVDLNHLPSDTGDSIIGKQIRWVSPYTINAVFGQGVQPLQRFARVQM